MGAWRYRVWANHGITRDCMEVRAVRYNRNVDVDPRGKRIVTTENEYAKYDPDREGFSWVKYHPDREVPPFLSISGQQFFTIPEDEGEELMSALLPYRVDVEIQEDERMPW